MKKTLLSLLFAAGSVAAIAQAEVKPLPIGASIPLPTTALRNIDNQMITLEKAKTDKGLLVMFSCNTCPFVVKAEGRTQEAISLVRSTGIGMVVLNSNVAQRDDADSPEQMRIYGKPKYIGIPYLDDQNAAFANAFGATRTPEVFLFDGSGKLVYKGAMEDKPGDTSSSTNMYLFSAIKAMLAGTPITPAETKSVGCSIKR